MHIQTKIESSYEFTRAYTHFVSTNPEIREEKLRLQDNF